MPQSILKKKKKNVLSGSENYLFSFKLLLQFSSILLNPKPQSNPTVIFPAKNNQPLFDFLFKKPNPQNPLPRACLIVSMRLHSSSTDSPISSPNSNSNSKPKSPISHFIDFTLLLSDELLLRVLSKSPNSQRNSNFLVCKRWFHLQGRLVRSLRVTDFDFLLSGRLIFRFPNLNHVDLVSGSLVSSTNSSVLLSNGAFSMRFDPLFLLCLNVGEKGVLRNVLIDKGLKVLAGGCPGLRKLGIVGGSELGLLNVAMECELLQELELYRCSDCMLQGIAGFENLQILKLVGNVGGLFSSVVTDVGLTIVARGCRRLVKLEVCGCEGSFDGVKAIGQCCQMLEELTVCDHRMDDGWLAGLSYCENLKTLKIMSCKRIDANPGPDECLSSCPALERLHLQNSQLRDNASVRALFMTCGAAREILIRDCWGLDDDMLSFANTCWRVKLLLLEGCSLLTTEGLESVVLQWKELQSLEVVSCKNIKDSCISPALSQVFSVLKNLKWRPDTKSLLSSSLLRTCMGKKGARFF